MTSKQGQIDSGILQYTPKGAYYEDADEQFNRVFQMWSSLFNYDRTLFCLTTLLAGTGFSKGAMSHMLLGNPIKNSGGLPIPEGLAFDYESKVILYNLAKERMPRALKNLLMLTGADGFVKINNSRTRKIILEYIFNREPSELDGMAVNFKGKLKTLIRHALGKQTLSKILNGDTKTFRKWIGRYNPGSVPALFHIFDKEPVCKGGVSHYYPQIDKYWALKKAAQSGDVDEFRKFMKGMPQRTVMGFRNTYKVAIDKAEVYEKATVSEKESIQLESAAKRSGNKTFKVNYKNQELYDLWKSFYHKLMTGDASNMDEIESAIAFKGQGQNRIDIGECVVVVDASRSMIGSDQRPLHPFLTSLCLISALDNVKDIIYIGGKIVTAPTTSKVNVLIPHNSTGLWRGLVDAITTGVKNIIVISDGYENEPKGMFEHAYNHFKNAGYNFNILHLNPVFAADAKQGTTRRIAADIEPMPLADYKFLETEIIFKKLLDNRDMVRNLLVQKYQKLIEGGH